MRLSESQHPSWVSAAAGMQPYQGKAGAAPRAQAGPSPAGFGCHREERTRHVQPIPLPAMQQNLNYVYPQIFWVDGCADAGASCPPAPPVAPFPPPVPDRSRKPRNNRERRSVGFLVMFLLILVAFTGVGLCIFKIFHLEKELDELREVRSAWLVAGPWGNREKETLGIVSEMLRWCRAPQGAARWHFSVCCGRGRGVLVPVRDCSVGD